MFYAECSRNIWGGGQRLFWPHFESIALHCRVRVGQQGSNIQMWRKHESFVQYLARYWLLWNSCGPKITIPVHNESVDDEKVVSCHEQAGQIFSSMQWSRGRLASDSDYFADISTRAPLNNKSNVYETNQMQSKHICMKNNNDQVRRLTSFNHH